MYCSVLEISIVYYLSKIHYSLLRVPCAMLQGLCGTSDERKAQYLKCLLVYPRLHLRKCTCIFDFIIIPPAYIGVTAGHRIAFIMRKLEPWSPLGHSAVQFQSATDE